MIYSLWVTHQKLLLRTKIEDDYDKNDFEKSENERQRKFASQKTKYSTTLKFLNSKTCV